MATPAITCSSAEIPITTAPGTGSTALICTAPAAGCRPSDPVRSRSTEISRMRPPSPAEIIRSRPRRPRERSPDRKALQDTGYSREQAVTASMGRGRAGEGKAEEKNWRVNLSRLPSNDQIGGTQEVHDEVGTALKRQHLN